MMKHSKKSPEFKRYQIYPHIKLADKIEGRYRKLSYRISFSAFLCLMLEKMEKLLADSGLEDDL